MNKSTIVISSLLVVVLICWIYVSVYLIFFDHPKSEILSTKDKIKIGQISYRNETMRWCIRNNVFDIEFDEIDSAWNERMKYINH